MSAGTMRVRLDELLVRRGHVASREKAKALVLAGRVAVAGMAHAKPGRLVTSDVAIEVRPPRAYVGRGGFKLAHALDRFALDPKGRVCADIGASTGGFTDCLLQRGAFSVYAVDVGYGQLDWSLRNDPRVTVLDRTNARYLDCLPEPVQFVTVDVSFISLRLVLPAIRRIALPEAEVVALVKPQFEAGRTHVGKGGVVRDPSVHEKVLDDLAEWLEESDFELVAAAASPIRGAAGNVEFLTHVRVSHGERSPDLSGRGRIVREALAETQGVFSASPTQVKAVEDLA